MKVLTSSMTRRKWTFSRNTNINEFRGSKGNFGESGMRFDIYGRFQLDVRREADCWQVYRHELGKRAKVVDVVVPSDLAAEEIATWLDDVFHEFAGIGQRVERLS
jgi:hypothetical protein